MNPWRNRLILAMVWLLAITSVHLLLPTEPAHAAGKEFWRLKAQRQLAANNALRARLAAMRPAGPLYRRAAMWRGLHLCEGSWTHRAPFQGGLQFHPRTWKAYRRKHNLWWFPLNAYQAAPYQQILMGEMVLHAQGRNAWPGCTRQGAW